MGWQALRRLVADPARDIPTGMFERVAVGGDSGGGGTTEATGGVSPRRPVRVERAVGKEAQTKLTAAATRASMLRWRIRRGYCGVDAPMADADS